MRVYRLIPNPDRLHDDAWARSTEQRECSIASCCEAGARHTASLMFRTEQADDVASPWLLGAFVSCVPQGEAPPVGTDPRAIRAPASALRRCEPAGAPGGAGLTPGPTPAPGEAAEAKLIAALADLARTLNMVAHAQDGAAPPFAVPGAETA